MAVKSFVAHISVIALTVSVLSGCGSSASKSEIDPTTGMPVFFCGSIKPDFQKAYKDFWNLTKGTSVSQAIDSLNALVDDTNAAKSLSSGTSGYWLDSVNQTSIGLINFLGGATDAASGQVLAGTFNANYSALSNYCK
jgi:hypothetical protein